MRGKVETSWTDIGNEDRCQPIMMLQPPNIDKSLMENTNWNQDAHLSLELASRCNLRCNHCYLSSGPYIDDRPKVGLETWTECLRDARQLGIRYVQFIGGEPTLYPMFQVLLNRASELSFRGIEVYSNATKIDEELFSSMEKNEVSLATSLYGSTPFEHDTFTGVRGSFMRTISNIGRGLSKGIPVRVSVVRGKDDWEIAKRTVACARQLGVKHVSSDIVREFGRGKGFKSGVRRCAGCGRSVVRVCSDGKISGCAMDAEPSLGHIRDGLSTALRRLGGACVAAKHAETRMT